MNSREKDLRIGIIGVGTVGGALQHYFEKKGEKVFLYDKPKSIGSKEEVGKADIVFVCVPTPYRKKNGFDLSFVEESVSQLSNGKVVVIKSTVLPGSTDRIQEENKDKKILFSPEFLTESSAIEDTLHPSRQIVGFTERSRDVAGEILGLLPRAPFEKMMPAKEAEMVKYFGNTFLATKVIFANQIYELCERLGIDYDQVKEAAVKDPRIGETHLDVWHAGYRGYGGKCFPKDMRALIQLGRDSGSELRLHEVVEKINNRLMKDQGFEPFEKLSSCNKEEEPS